ncbi:NACHT domain-containing NTPase [Actinomadura chokoriensis]|uniref:NACHT domain-containing protein n=1 Tax=Actinomadura chokoriensis TaxID=454156 RepID=A0ABV4QYD3_9ACTN
MTIPLTLATVLYQWTLGLEKADQFGGALALPATIGSAALTVSTLIVALQARHDDQRAEDDQALVDLAEAVQAQWQDEERRRLPGNKPLVIGWAQTHRRVQATRSAVFGAGTDGHGRDGEGAELADALLELRHRQLVVIGEPGAGKTALTVRTLLELFTRPELDAIPVLFPLSAWNPEISLNTWMAERLAEDHGFSEATAHRLVSRVLPLLDGLDEIPSSLRPDALRGIDRELSNRPFLLTCRSEEYERAVTDSRAFLSRARVVEVESVEHEDAIAFFSDAQMEGEARWEPIVRHLREHPEAPLAEALETPLMVDLLRTVYRTHVEPPAELLDAERFPDRESIEHHLLDSLIPAVYSDRNADRRYRPDRARRWLTTLSRNMAAWGTRDIELWRLRSPAVPVLVGLLLAYGGWRLGELVFGWTGGLWLAAALGTAGAVTALISGSEVPVNARPATEAGTLLRWNGVVAVGWTALVGGLTGSLVATLLADYHDLASTGWVLAAVFALSAALSTSWGAYHISRLWLALRGRLPFLLIRFVQDAHENAAVLRRVGAVYQFRHARLQDALTAQARVVAGEPRRLPGWTSIVPGNWLRTPVLRLGVLVVAACGAFWGFAWVVQADSVSIVAGHRPRAIDSSVCTPGDFNQPCSKGTTLAWERLRTGQPHTTAFEITGRSRAPVKSWRGDWSVEGCQGSAVDATINAGGATSTERLMAGRPSPDWPWPKAGRNATRFTLTLTRVDTRPCALTVKWRSPGIFRDPFHDFWQRVKGEDG